MPFPRRLCGRLALVSKFPPRICLQILEQKDYAHENQCAKSHLAMDAFFARFLPGLNVSYENCTLRCGSKDFVSFRKIELDIGGSIFWNTQPNCLAIFTNVTVP